MEVKEDTLYIECDCGFNEEQPADQQRWHIQNFEFIGNRQTWDAPDALLYRCKCGSDVTGKILTPEGYVDENLPGLLEQIAKESVGAFMHRHSLPMKDWVDSVKELFNDAYFNKEA